MEVGNRIRLIWTDDPSGLPPGSEGIIVRISEFTKADASGIPGAEKLIGKRKVWVKWDIGHNPMALIEGYDKFEVMK